MCAAEATGVSTMLALLQPCFSCITAFAFWLDGSLCYSTLLYMTLLSKEQALYVVRLAVLGFDMTVKTVSCSIVSHVAARQVVWVFVCLGIQQEVCVF